MKATVLVLVLRVLQVHSQSTVGESACDNQLSVILQGVMDIKSALPTYSDESSSLQEIKDEIVDTLEQRIGDKLDENLSSINCPGGMTPPKTSCDRGWTKIKNSCYHKPPFQGNRADTKAYCRDVMRGHLVTFADQEELQAVRTAFVGDLWVGALKNGAGEWVWEECVPSSGGGVAWTCPQTPVEPGLWGEDQPGLYHDGAYVPNGVKNVYSTTYANTFHDFVCEYNL